MTQRSTGISWSFRLAGLLLLCLGLAWSAAFAAAKTPDASLVAKCKADLAKRLHVSARAISVAETLATTWPDAALGLPEMDAVYAQALTPGWKIVLETRSTRYLYTTSQRAFRYGGPVGTWAHSLLFLQPILNEPNMNGDLYQCSLVGTNCVRLCAGVTAYYPQEQGTVIVKRRTSRSSHELLYVKAAKAAKPTILLAAFDFGAAAFNGAQDTWAGFVRPRLGGNWHVVVARIGQTLAQAQTLPLPDGVQPGRIAWSADQVFILTSDGKASYAIMPGAATPTWKSVGVHLFPGRTSYMLNKSESLEITQVTKDGKPSIEVARVWFTGDRKVVATIPGVTLRDDDLLGLRYAFIAGERAGKPVAYTVDLATGEVLTSFRGAGHDIQPFAYPPVSHP